MRLIVSATSPARFATVSPGQPLLGTPPVLQHQTRRLSKQDRSSSACCSGLPNSNSSGVKPGCSLRLRATFDHEGNWRLASTSTIIRMRDPARFMSSEGDGMEMSGPNDALRLEGIAFLQGAARTRAEAAEVAASSGPNEVGGSSYLSPWPSPITFEGRMPRCSDSHARERQEIRITDRSIGHWKPGGRLD